MSFLFVFVLLVVVQFLKISFCKHIRLSYLINACLLTYLLTYTFTSKTAQILTIQLSLLRNS